MLNVAPALDQVRAGRTLQLAFLSSVVSLASAFAAVGSTIPLFNIYRAEDGSASAGISMTVVAYSVGTIGTLLALGRLSNHVGRRATALASLGLLVLGCLVLLNVHHIGILIAGRGRGDRVRRRGTGHHGPARAGQRDRARAHGPNRRARRDLARRADRVVRALEHQQW